MAKLRWDNLCKKTEAESSERNQVCPDSPRGKMFKPGPPWALQTFVRFPIFPDYVILNATNDPIPTSCVTLRSRHTSFDLRPHLGHPLKKIGKICNEMRHSHFLNLSQSVETQLTYQFFNAYTSLKTQLIKVKPISLC